MIVFWIVTAVMIVIALALIAPSLLRASELPDSDRDTQNVIIARERLAELKSEHEAGSLSEEEYEQTKLELEQALLIDLDSGSNDSAAATSGGTQRSPFALLFSALFIVGATLSVYLYLGTPQLVDGEALVAQEQDGELPSIDEMLTMLEARLAQNPEDAEGWYLLGRTHMALKDYQKAATAFDKVNQLVSDQPSILLALADALAMAAGGDLQGRPAELIRRAVSLAPDDQTALWLAGMVESQSGNPALALQHLRHLKPMLATDPDATAQVDRLIAAAEGQLETTGPGSMPEQTAEAAAPAAAASAAITARVSLSAELAGRVKPDESLFIYARALTGPKMPLAAVRMKAGDLPATIELTEGQAMVPGMSLSRFPQVVVGARISQSGDAIATSGDLLGEVSPVTVNDDGVVELVIDSVVP